MTVLRDGEEYGLEANNNKLSIDSRRLVPVVQFGLWFFAFMLLESFVNSSAATLLGASAVNAAYSLGIFCTATGLLVFGLAHARSADLCKRAFIIVATACAVATLSIPFAQNAGLLAFLSCASLLSCGFVGGRVHLGMALEFGEGPWCGRAIGAATGIVVCVQFLVQNLAQGPALELVCIPASLVALVFFDVRHQDRCMDANTGASVRTWTHDPADKQRHGAYLVIAAAILTVIFTLNDSIVVPLDASGTVQLFSGVRLFYALGLVVSGLLFDLGPRFCFTFTTVAVQIMAVLVPYFLRTPEWYNLNMAIFYFYGGFYVMFVTAEFVIFSAQMHHRALWAALGRTTRSYVAALSVIPVALLYDAFGVISLAAMAAVLNMALLAVCMADAMLLARCDMPERQGLEPPDAAPQSIEDAQEPAADPAKLSERDLDRYAQSIGLTGREAQVLVLLVATEDKNDKMANDLGISRRTLQRHIANIYDKAGVQSRIGLFQAVAAYVAG